MGVCSRTAWLQHDNAPVHRARVVEEFLRARGVVLLPWPAQSPDLNPIENLWAQMSKRVYDKAAYPNVDSLWARIQSEWAQIGTQELHALYNSMGRRMDAVEKSRGYPTRY